MAKKKRADFKLRISESSTDEIEVFIKDSDYFVCADKSTLQELWTRITAAGFPVESFMEQWIDGLIEDRKKRSCRPINLIPFPRN